MKSVVFFIFMGLITIPLFAFPAIGTDLKAVEECTFKNQQEGSSYMLNRLLSLPKTSQKTYDRTYNSGCCSWHQGVCGCSMGRAVCCDGVLSPSCNC